MQTDLKSRTSFFDDDDLSILFIFKKIDKSHKDLDAPQIIRENLTRQVPGANAAPQPGSYALHNRTLVYYKNMSSKLPESYLDLAHSKLKVVPPTTNNTSTSMNYGFSLTKNGATYEFYSPEKEVIDDWMVALKNVCILTTFHEEYKALKMIGRGSFAKVYLVESKTNGKMFAVKAFTKESVIISNKANAKPSMINEIDLMRVLDHDHVIKLYEVYETEKSIYLVIELIQGKSLQDVLKRSAFKEDYSEYKIMKMIYAILDALAYLASKGIMHRDLKPDNILVDKDNKIKIVDFGLATYIDLPEYIFKKCGTPGYIAPEVFKYDQKNPATFYDHHSDVFSAGCILYYMLFGSPFFEGANASEILKLNRKYTSEFEAIKTVQDELNNPGSKISQEGLKLLTKLLEFDPKKRASASEVLNHPYFLPMLNASLHSMDMSPSVGSLTKHRSVSIDYSFHQSRPDSIASPGGVKDRFAEKDSLYLDMGRPELNGKISTLANGSNNDSLLLHRGDSHISVASKEGSISSFAKGQQPDQKSRSKSFRGHAGAGNNQSFLKAAIFRNMAKNSDFPSEEIKDDVGDRQRKRRESDRPSLYGQSVSNYSPTNKRNSSRSSGSDVGSSDDVCSENPQVQLNMEKIKIVTPDMKPSKHAHSAALKLRSTSPSPGVSKKKTIQKKGV